MLNYFMGELSLVKYLLLLTIPYLIWFIFSKYWDHKILIDQKMSKKEVKVVKTNMFNFQVKSSKRYQLMISLNMYLWLSMLVLIGMFFGSYLEYGYFTSSSHLISSAFFTLVTASLILLENLLLVIRKFRFWNIDNEQKFFEEYKDKPIVSKSQKKIRISFTLLSFILSIVNIILFFNSTVY